MGEETKAQKGYSEMSFPKLQTMISEDSISLEYVLFLEVILAKILFSKAENLNHQCDILFKT